MLAALPHARTHACSHAHRHARISQHVILTAHPLWVCASQVIFAAVAVAAHVPRARAAELALGSCSSLF
eukprot:scaffold118284_cov87-Phaeocystis_antarctica.AAC.4